MAKKRKAVKARSYLCLVCGRKAEKTRKVKCCGKDMTAESKGSWNL
jgi:hypothetical protein